MSKRSVDRTSQVQRLEQRHRVLGAKVAELDGRMSLSSREHFELNELKKKKLAAKDALADLRRTPT